MSALPNPLQELAEKLRDEMFSRHMGKMDVCQRVADAFLPILTAAVGTLLQAERAAMIEVFIGKLTERIDMHDREAHQLRETARMTGGEINEVAWDYHIDCRTTLRGFFADVRDLATPEAASALSAAVQRETEKLREWKESASNILNQLDLQAIGKEIGLHLGQDVSPNVLPAIKKLKALLRRCYDMGNLPDKLETDIRAALQ